MGQPKEVDDLVYGGKLKGGFFLEARTPSIIANDFLLTGQEQACTRITRLFVYSFGCHHAENGSIHRKMVVDCPLVIISKVKLFFRPDKTRKKE